ncbi:hypothetical protein ACHAXS_012376 [Conticribra weissflogii]
MRSRFHAAIYQAIDDGYNQIPSTDLDNIDDDAFAKPSDSNIASNRQDDQNPSPEVHKGRVDEIDIPLWKIIVCFGALALISFAISFGIANNRGNYIINGRNTDRSGKWAVQFGTKSPEPVASSSLDWQTPSDDVDGDDVLNEEMEDDLNIKAVGYEENESVANGEQIADPYITPYALKWGQGYTVPWWAKKHDPKLKPKEIDKIYPSNEQLCFVHVGKAGGSTIGCSLGFSLHCSSENQTVSDGMLPTLTAHVFHRAINDCVNDNRYYLFVVRDPLARLMSAFYYERPNIREEGVVPGSWHARRRRFYYDCGFYIMEQFAKKGLIDFEGNVLIGDDVVRDECQTIAYEAITGRRGYLVHWSFNYQFYFDALKGPAHDKIVVIRNEHMVEDWNSIENLMGGRNDVVSGVNFPHDNSHKTNETEKFLSDESRRAFCQALCNDIHAYKSILRLGKNLKPEDVKESMAELRKVCPREADMADMERCQDDLPDIAVKIKRNRVALEEYSGKIKL